MTIKSRSCKIVEQPLPFFSRANRVRHPPRSRPAVFAMDCEGDSREEAQKTQDPQRQDDALKQAQVPVDVLGECQLDIDQGLSVTFDPLCRCSAGVC